MVLNIIINNLLLTYTIAEGLRINRSFSRSNSLSRIDLFHNYLLKR